MKQRTDSAKHARPCCLQLPGPGYPTQHVVPACPPYSSSDFGWSRLARPSRHLSGIPSLPGSITGDPDILVGHIPPTNSSSSRKLMDTIDGGLSTKDQDPMTRLNTIFFDIR
ncbi:hypothetical protein Plhal703r1_c06g0034141 [Plasmopara halstedii]